MKLLHIILISIFICSVNIYGQVKPKKSNVKYIKIEKSKFNAIKQNPNYRIVVKNKTENKIKKKKPSVIEALKKEFGQSK